jgi:hypothetical protein
MAGVWRCGWVSFRPYGADVAPSVWREVTVEGGPDGILARRPVTAHPQGYIYDLWLVERLATQASLRRP